MRLGREYVFRGGEIACGWLESTCLDIWGGETGYNDMPGGQSSAGHIIIGGRVVSHIAASAVKVGTEGCAVGDALVGIVVRTLLQLGLRLKQF